MKEYNFRICFFYAFFLSLQKILVLTRAFEPCERTEGVTAGGSVYLRSQFSRQKRTTGRDGARAGNRKHAILSCIGICRQVGTAAAHR